MKQSAELTALLLGSSKRDKGEASDDLVDAARDFLDAIKDDDEKQLALALERAVGALSCGGCETDDSEEE